MSTGLVLPGRAAARPRTAALSPHSPEGLTAAETDTATYQQPVSASTGFVHLFVGGVMVVDNGVLQLDALPGCPVRAVR